MNKTKRLTLLGVLTAVAMVLSYVEMLLPPLYSGLPGIKLGLSNIVIIFLLYKFSFKDALAVSLIRVCLVSLLFSNAVVFIYSFSGAVLSLIFMVILKKTNRFSNIGVSIVGAVSHNLGQVLTAVILMQTPKIAYYMAVLLISGALSGVIIGIISAWVLKYTEKFKL